MKAIIFGANGQDGFYLDSLCKSKRIETVCVSRTGNFTRCDVSNFNEVDKLIKSHLPDYVFHLAANSTTRHDALFENHETISTGTLCILEAVKKYCPSARVFLTGTGLQFVNNRKPIKESDEFQATSPYSVARIQSVYAARYYRSLGIKTYVGYLFHHESPYRKPTHVSQLIALAVKRIASGSQEVIQLGNISVEKEWTFAGDIVDAIFTLVSQDEIFEATIGSGRPYSIQEWLTHCFACIHKNWNDYVKIKENFLAEYSCLVSDPSTIKSLGWEPKVHISDLASLMVL